jgi:hypothetical protein
MTFDKLSVCLDCYDVIAGNTDCIDADREGEILTAIGNRIFYTGDRIDEFTWSQCELCRSKLGGERYEITEGTCA